MKLPIWPIWLFNILTLSALLTGCATSSRTLMPPPTNTASAVVDSASYQGRFAVRYEDAEKGIQNVYGHFVWREVGGNITLLLLNPLGQILAVLEVTPSEASLKLPKRPTQTAANIEDLMQQALGFTLPINNLRTWLRPAQFASLTLPLTPSSSASPTTNTQQGNNLSATQFKQDGWTIEYVGTNDKRGTPLTRIRRINLKRDEPLTDVKLVIDP